MCDPPALRLRKALYADAMIAKSTRTLTALAILTAITACGSGTDEIGPGGATEEEAKALDEAAEMIEQTTMPTEEKTPPADGNQPRTVRQPEG